MLAQGWRRVTYSESLVGPRASTPHLVQRTGGILSGPSLGKVIKPKVRDAWEGNAQGLL